AADYLRMFGLVTTGWMWLRMAKVAAAKGDGDRKYASKLATARFYFSRLLPQAHALAAQIDAGAATVMALDAAQF
ncbi:MAG TPA: acyl-CoA dehydrogenase C-terminal domain-containing protein, partial [Gemmatimonadaceae bacterium]|nr:acyl-CoA dehydrogenase C-terminal domain-containing protein [Gemmatimonadaceae bacterium]